MLIKLAIVGTVLVVGGILLFPESLDKLGDIAPKEAQPINEGAKQMRDDTANVLNNKVDSTIGSISEKVSSLKGISVFPTTDKTEDGAGKTKETNERHQTKFTPSEVNHDVAKKENSDANNLIDSKDKNTNPDKSLDNEDKFAFEELSLTTKQDENGVIISYKDKSDKTTSVDITMRNSERVLFSGTFRSSNFDTTISDVKNEPHLVELVIEHEEYGTLTSSAYNSGEGTNEINGIFTRS